MHPRIYGTEFEYGVFSWELVPKSTDLAGFLSLVSGVVDNMPAPLNGSRIYIDSGKHPEYSTPECLTPREVVAYEKAGELILEDAFKNGVVQGDLKGNVKFYRTAVDKRGTTHGYHENYLLSREVPKDYLVMHLAPFLVTRVVYAGSGNVKKDFQISGRAEHIQLVSGGSTTQNRAIINCKDEPLADQSRYRRLHLIVSDPNMSEYATYLRIGATSLMLDLVEDMTMPCLEIEDPVGTLHRLARTTSEWPVKLKEGRTMTAIDLQRMYLDAAYRHLRRGCKSDSPKMRCMNNEILDLWDYTLDALDKDPMMLSDQLDWTIEKRMLETHMKKHGMAWDDPMVSTLDLKYHDTDKLGSAFYTLQRKGLVKRLLSDDDIEGAVSTPPNTRAKGRSLYIRKMRERGIKLDAKTDRWGALGYDQSSPATKIPMPYPFRTYEEEVEDYFRSR